MPQLVAFALVGAGLIAGYRWASRQMEKAHTKARQTEAELRRGAGLSDEPRDLGQLELDSKTGEYRPRES